MAVTGFELQELRTAGACVACGFVVFCAGLQGEVVSEVAVGDRRTVAQSYGAYIICYDEDVQKMLEDSW